jgi:hypothetical protein
MGKLKLELDALAVESFETTRAGESEGTVFANQGGGGITGVSCFQVSCHISCFASCIHTCGQTCQRLSCGPTCHVAATCHVSCFATCYASCLATCNFTCFGTCHHTCIQQVCGAVASGGVACEHLPHTPVLTINQGTINQG